MALVPSSPRFPPKPYGRVRALPPLAGAVGRGTSTGRSAGRGQGPTPKSVLCKLLAARGTQQHFFSFPNIFRRRKHNPRTRSDVGQRQRLLMMHQEQTFESPDLSRQQQAGECSPRRHPTSCQLFSSSFTLARAFLPEELPPSGARIWSYGTQKPKATFKQAVHFSLDKEL